MKYEAILFDLDGTLLPLDLDIFTKKYFGELGKVLAPHGYDPEQLVKSIWAGTKAMMKNDGSMTNRDRFWQTFEEITGRPTDEAEKLCDTFYSNEFHRAREVCGENPLAIKAVNAARAAAGKVIVATNPLFPMVGQLSRLSWVDLTPDMFDMITSYEENSFCKPNPDYYRSICSRLSLDPAKCLMIGNDEDEDMHAAAALGMDTYLVCDCIIPSKTKEYTGKKGTFAEMLEFLLSCK